MPQYFLTRHAFACETAGHAVFLDLKRDKYTAVPPEDLPVLRAAVHGWPAGAEDAWNSADPTSRTGTRQPDEDEIIRDLIREGLLTTDAACGKAAARPNLQTPTTTFFTRERLWPQLDRQHLRNFIYAWGTTTLLFRTLPIRWVVARVRRRKEAQAPKAPPFDIRKARFLTTLHFALQPAFYSSQDACLRNSLTLVEFLARYQVYPTLVFGVRMEPFAAHAWVQEGEVVFGDPVEHVRGFVPIMAV